MSQIFQKIAHSCHVGQIWLVRCGKKCFKKSQTKGFDPITHIASCILGQLLPPRPIFASWELQKASQAWKIKILVDFANVTNFPKKSLVATTYVKFGLFKIEKSVLRSPKQKGLTPTPILRPGFWGNFYPQDPFLPSRTSRRPLRHAKSRFW